MEKYMKLALKEAKKALKHDDVPIGAVIVKNDKVISKGHNKKEKTKKVTRHAEIEAIEKACKKIKDWHLDGCDIYITVEPCKMCYAAIEQSRIKKIIYGVDNDKFGYFSSKNKSKNITVEKNIYSEECLQILKKFFVKKRK